MTLIIGLQTKFDKIDSMQTFQSKLIEKTQLTENIISFKFSLAQAQGFTFKAGQYIIVNIPQEDGKTAKRLYSIASSPLEKKHIELIVKIFPNGIGSSHLANMDTNQEVALQGPAGMFTLDESKEKNNVMFLATGTGIAPIRSMIHQLLSSEEKCSKLETVNLLWGLKSSTDIYYHEEFLTLSEKYPKFKIKLCLSRETNLNKIDFADKEICSLNRIDIEYKNMLEKNEKLITDCDYYLCSGRQIVESIREELYSLQIPKENVHFERF